MDDSMKRSPWQIANATVLLLHLALPVWLFALMYTPAISSILLLVMMICGLLPGVLRDYLCRGTLQKPLGMGEKIDILCAENLPAATGPQ